nr:reverse transcriptase domain-containing protein [Tanacetum cinerariifolium]
MIPTTSSSFPKVVERETEVTKDTVPPTNNGNTKDVQPLIVQIENSISNSELVIAPVAEPVVAPVSASKPNQKPSIPYPSRLHDQKLRDKANDQKEIFFQIFKDLDFNISFADALILMPKFGPTIKTLLTDKDKLYELARTPLNEHCSAVHLKKFPEKLRDPDKFLIPCDFTRMDECLALTDLVDRSISRPIGVAEDVFVKVGKFHFSADFVVVDFDADPRVPLILGRTFLKTRKDLIVVYEGELTLRVRKEAITFNLDQTSRYSANYNDMTANRIDVIDMDCEEYSQEVLGFSDVFASGNPTPYYDPIVSTSSLTLTSFGNSDFLLEEVDAFLALEDDPTSPEVDHSYFDTEGDILLLEAFLNDDPSLPPPTQGKYLPQVRKELIIYEAKNDKSSIDEPPEVELKDLPPHLEYAFLEGDDKLPVIIAKDLSVEEKASHKGFEVTQASHCLETLRHKGAENLAADHLSRLDNPHQSMLDKKEINETFPLETLNMVSFRGDSSTPCVTFGTTPSCSKSVRIKSSGGVFTARKPLTFSRLATMDPLGDIMARTTPPRRFGTLRAIISGRGTHFCNDQFTKVMLKYGATHRLATAYHPQTSGQAFRTAFKTPIGCTLYKLMYGKACHLPIKLEHKAYWALKHANFDLQTTGDHRKVQLNKLNELRDQAYKNSLIYKEKTKRNHDLKIKDSVFNVGDRVLLFNSRLKIFSGKLKTRWSRPFTITHVFPNGTVKLSQTDGPNFKVNGHRLKHYFGEDIPKMVVPNLQTFPKDQ